ncbi:CLOCK-interacting pacemaker isoform X2 [Erinaceus europaeus]|nr:CLOCK-interacting pacemaker isoform X2 [Erinaceus europaeus]XP_016046787.1 CLOCK-interacting pacemaker isoform X2 [Erinaceus europaeus]
MSRPVERKSPARESPRRLCAKPGRATEMRKGARLPGLAAESDKDSGFSDGGSEQLESEDRPSTTWSRKDGHSAPTPVVVMKNVLVKQGGGSSGLQSWMVQSSFEVLPGQPQLLLLHPPAPPASPGQAGDKKPPDTRDYLPILNSYPKIAPHPGKRGRGPGPDDRSEPQKRPCPQRWPLGEPGAPNPAPRGARTLQPAPTRRVAKVPGLPSLCPASPACTVDGTLLGPAGTHSSPHRPSTPEVPPLLPEPPRQSRHRRFQNTLVALRRSGLLEVTLKTKELIRQNQATQLELEQLRQHTQLLLEAAGGHAPQAWAQLQAALGPTTTTTTTVGSGHAAL